MPMLTQEDLKAIGTLVGEQIREEVPKIIKELVPPMITEGLDSLEVRMNTKFDAMHDHMEDMENRLVTKSYLDDKLAHYVKRPF